MTMVQRDRAAELGAAAASESGKTYGSIAGGIGGIISGIGALTMTTTTVAVVPVLVVLSITATIGYVAGGFFGRKLGEENGKHTGINHATMGDSESQIIQHASDKGKVDGAVIGIGTGIASGFVSGFVISQPQVIDKISTASNIIDIPTIIIDMSQNTGMSDFMPQLIGEGDMLMKSI